MTDLTGPLLVPTADELLSESEEFSAQVPEPVPVYWDEPDTALPLALEFYDAILSREIGPVTPGELKIVATDLSKNPSAGAVLIKNNTSYEISAAEFLEKEPAAPAAAPAVEPLADGPVVLIYHTHGTESYAEEGRGSYAKKSLPRSKDVAKNVVAVGKVLADTLNARGIPTLHCEIMHDAASYNNSYTYSRQTLKDYMAEYPTLRYAFDIHRDALVGRDTVYKVLTYDESRPTAQVMLVVGTDSAGARHPNWRDTLGFAVRVQSRLTTRLETLARPICVKNASYNQQCTGQGFLIEIGTCVNTLAEAKAAAVLVGEALAAQIREEWLSA